MKRFYILLVIIILISCDTASQFDSPAESYFVKFYGEDGNHEGVDFIANDDGTFILLGNVKVPGINQRIYMVKVDAQGMVIGEPKSFGANVDHFARDIEHTPDGNMIVVAEALISQGNRDVFVIIVDNNLNIIREKTVSGILKTPGGLEADEEVNSVSVISDGYIVAGSTTAVGLRDSGYKPKSNDGKDALHLRLRSNLDIVEQGTGLWFYTTGKDEGTDVLVKMIEITPSMFYGFGYTNVPIFENNEVLNNKYWAFNIGSTAVPAGYEQIFNSGNTVENSVLSSVIKSPAQSVDGYVLSGVKANTSLENQSYLLKLTSTLIPGQNNVLNEETPTDLGINVGSETSVTSLSQGGYLLLSNNNQPTNDNINISLIKLSNTFKMEWQGQILFGGVGDDFAGSVTELPDRKIAVIGTMTLGGIAGQTKMAFMKLNRDGKLND